MNNKSNQVVTLINTDTGKEENFELKTIADRNLMFKIENYAYNLTLHPEPIFEFMIYNGNRFDFRGFPRIKYCKEIYG